MDSGRILLTSRAFPAYGIYCCSRVESSRPGSGHSVSVKVGRKVQGTARSPTASTF
jgi:hypothetical protein